MNISTVASSSGAIGGMWLVIYLIVIVVALAGIWTTFQKANRPGWAAIIPIYNIYTLVKVAGRDGWWVILYFIPLVNIVIHIIVSVDVAKAFGKSDVFGIFGLWLFSFVGYPMLGFGDATYHGAQGVGPTPPAPTQPVSQPPAPTQPVS